MSRRGVHPRDVCDQLKAVAHKGGAFAWEHFRVQHTPPHALTMNGIPTEENFTHKMARMGLTGVTSGLQGAARKCAPQR
jgi:hypothetical protein